MIDYTQQAFSSAPQIIDPIPTVADYLDDYEARNDAWYRSWAFPLNEGYGARPSSFERRGEYIPPIPTTEVPVDVLPPVLRNTYEEDDGYTAPGDRPVGALVRDVGGMSVPDLYAEYETLISPVGTYAPLGVGALNAVLGGLPILPAMMARESMEDRRMEVLGSLLPQISSAGILPDVGTFSRVGTPTTQGGVAVSPGGTMVFTEPDVLPYEPERESRGTGDTGRDTYQGGEVGAGGWAGGGGL